MWDRLSNGWALGTSSWQVLRQDKKLIFFPIVSGLVCVLILVSFAVPVALLAPELGTLPEEAADGRAQVPLWVWPVLFAFYFCNYFIVVFFNSALVHCALVRFSGGEPTIADGLTASVRCLPQIVAWALVSATVGVLLKVIESTHEKAGEIVSLILGTAWSIMTYFVVPVLVVERVGPFSAVYRSIQILKNTWGEALAGGFSIGLFQLVLCLPGIALLVLAVLAFGALPPLGLLLGVLGVIALLLALAGGSALSGILLAALYQYATGAHVPEGFDGDLFEHAFLRR